MPVIELDDPAHEAISQKGLDKSKEHVEGPCLKVDYRVTNFIPSHFTAAYPVR